MIEALLVRTCGVLDLGSAICCASQRNQHVWNADFTLVADAIVVFIDVYVTRWISQRRANRCDARTCRASEIRLRVGGGKEQTFRDSRRINSCFTEQVAGSRLIDADVNRDDAIIGSRPTGSACGVATVNEIRRLSFGQQILSGRHFDKLVVAVDVRSYLIRVAGGHTGQRHNDATQAELVRIA